MFSLVMALLIGAGASKAPPKDTHNRTVGALVYAMAGLKEAPNATVAHAVAAVCIAAGAHADIDPLWLVAVAYTESRLTLKAYDEKYRSHGPWQMGMSAARKVWPKVRKAQLYKWAPAAHMAAMYWDRLREKYGKAADVVYNCGPVRCRRRDGSHRKTTPATRGYWRRYKLLTRRVR